MISYQHLINELQITSGHIYLLNPPILEEKTSIIENLIKKPFPQELVDFYAFSDGLEIEMKVSKNKKYNLGGQNIPTLAYMFDDFKPISKKITEENMYEEPFFEMIWQDYTYEEVSKKHFIFIRRQKMFLAINGSSSNITIDFFDDEKPYQLYYQPNGDIDFYPLHISFAYKHCRFLSYFFANSGSRKLVWVIYE